MIKKPGRTGTIFGVITILVCLLGLMSCERDDGILPSSQSLVLQLTPETVPPEITRFVISVIGPDSTLWQTQLPRDTDQAEIPSEDVAGTGKILIVDGMSGSGSEERVSYRGTVTLGTVEAGESRQFTVSMLSCLIESLHVAWEQTGNRLTWWRPSASVDGYTLRRQSAGVWSDWRIVGADTTSIFDDSGELGNLYSVAGLFQIPYSSIRHTGPITEEVEQDEFRFVDETWSASFPIGSQLQPEIQAAHGDSEQLTLTFTAESGDQAFLVLSDTNGDLVYESTEYIDLEYYGTPTSQMDRILAVYHGDDVSVELDGVSLSDFSDQTVAYTVDERADISFYEADAQYNLQELGDLYEIGVHGDLVIWVVDEALNPGIIEQDIIYVDVTTSMDTLQVACYQRGVAGAFTATDYVSRSIDVVVDNDTSESLQIDGAGDAIDASYVEEAYEDVPGVSGETVTESIQAQEADEWAAFVTADGDQFSEVNPEEDEVYVEVKLLTTATSSIEVEVGILNISEYTRIDLTHLGGGLYRSETSLDLQVVGPLDDIRIDGTTFYVDTGSTLRLIYNELEEEVLVRIRTSGMVTWIDGDGDSIDTFRIGLDDAFLKVVDRDMNEDRGSVDSVFVVVLGEGGDEEEVAVIETGINSGIFESMALEIGFWGFGASQLNGIVETDPGQVTARYYDQYHPQSDTDDFKTEELTAQNGLESIELVFEPASSDTVEPGEEIVIRATYSADEGVYEAYPWDRVSHDFEEKMGLAMVWADSGYLDGVWEGRGTSQSEGELEVWFADGYGTISGEVMDTVIFAGLILHGAADTSFGTVHWEAETGISQTWVNASRYALQINGITVSDDAFSLDTGATTFPLNLDPDAELPVDIIFAPGGVGSYNGVIDVETDRGNLLLSVSGSGASGETGDLPDSLTLTDTNQTVFFTVTNESSDWPLAVDATLEEGEDEFGISLSPSGYQNTVSFDVEAASTDTVWVFFTPPVGFGGREDVTGSLMLETDEYAEENQNHEIILLGTHNSPPNAPSNPDPPNNATGVGYTPLLNWSCTDPDGDDLTFDLIVRLNSNQTIVINRTGLTQPSYQVQGFEALLEGTAYTWQVTANDPSDESTAGSSWRFITNRPPNAPTNPDPANNTEGVTTQPVLSWSCSDPDGDDLNYDLTVMLDNGTVVLAKTNLENAFYQIEAYEELAQGTWHTWMVTAYDDHGSEAVSSEWRFKTQDNSPPNQPNGPTPPDGATGISLQPTFGWSCTDPDGDDLSYTVEGKAEWEAVWTEWYSGTATDFTLGWELAPHTTYEWRVIADDGQGATTTGPNWYFTTLNRDPYPPTNILPANGATGVALQPLFSWSGGDPDGDGLTYVLEARAQGVPIWTELYSGTGTIHTPNTAFDAHTTYEWRVSAYDSYGGWATGPTWSFTTVNRPPTSPVNIIPANGATNVGLQPQFIWSCTDPDGDDLWFTVQGREQGASSWNVWYTGSSISFTMSDPLRAHTTYEWRVRAEDGFGGVTTGPATTFTTLNNSPNNPSDPAPVNGSTGNDVQPTFSWTGGDPDGDTVSYTVRGRIHNTVTFYEWYTGTATTFTYGSTPQTSGQSLDSSEWYDWQVIADDGFGGVTVGPFWLFQTQ